MTRMIMTRIASILALLCAGCFTAGTWLGDEGSTTSDLGTPALRRCLGPCAETRAACASEGECRALMECTARADCHDESCLMQCACDLQITKSSVGWKLHSAFIVCAIAECTECERIAWDCGAGTTGGFCDCLDTCGDMCEPICREVCVQDQAPPEYYEWAVCVSRYWIEGGGGSKTRAGG